MTRVTLEDILRKYFCNKKTKIIRKKRIYVDDVPDDLTKVGNRAYGKLIDLLYDVGRLTAIDVNNIVDELDRISIEEY